MNTISSKSIIAKLYRNLRIEDDSFEQSMIEWIAEGMDYIGYNLTYVQKEIIKQVADFKTLLPRDFVELTDVYYNSEATEETEAISYTQRLKNAALDFSTMNKLRAETYYNDVPTYTINSPVVTFSFETGFVQLLYKGLPIDEYNTLKIPDVSEVKEALEWYIILNLMKSGWQHPAGFNFQFVDAQWQRYCGQARSTIKMPTVADYERLAETWGSFYKQYKQQPDLTLVQYTHNILNE